MALQFQHAVLPEGLDSVPGWEVAAHYSPNGQSEVGGDFFDAVAHPDGSVSVFIGDVIGHGVEAAATMAQMRAAIRAFLTVDPAPAVVVGKLDNMFVHLNLPPFVTLVYALIRPDGSITFTNAGHHPPLVVGAAGATRFLMSVPRTPIGVRPAAVQELTEHLDPDDVLLLYTDGLIESRDEAFEVGMRALARHGSVLTRGPLRGGLPKLVRAAGRDRPSDDDVAAIAIRRAR